MSPWEMVILVYYVNTTTLMIYVAKIDMGSWTPQEYIFGPEIKWNDDWF